jgi:hypothetical protein
MYDTAAETVTYTHANENTGSWVDEIYYDDNDNSLVVVLEDETWPYTRRSYGYQGVPEDVAKGFFNASSFGTFYNDSIKRKFTGTSLGDPDDYEFTPVESKPAVAHPTYTSLRTVEQVRNTEGFTPKALSDKSDNVVSLTGRDEVASSNRRFTVSFTVNGEGVVKTADFNVDTVVDAVKAIEELAKMLSVSVDVVGVNLVD